MVYNTLLLHVRQHGHVAMLLFFLLTFPAFQLNQNHFFCSCFCVWFTMRSLLPSTMLANIGGAQKYLKYLCHVQHLNQVSSLLFFSVPILEVREQYLQNCVLISVEMFDITLMVLFSRASKNSKQVNRKSNSNGNSELGAGELNLRKC